MATRSTIAIEKTDGTVEQVYCHWDGYLSNNGSLLMKHYTNAARLQELIDLGNLSSLAANISPTGPHTFDNPQEDVCVFYGRDRGELGIQSRLFDSFDDYNSHGQREGYEYILRNVDGAAVWFVSIYGGKFVELTCELETQ